jgi:transposase
MEVTLMDYWAKAPMDRDQMALFSPTLDAWIPADHPVRLFDEILSRLDWSSWESHYFRCVGQPPIHPRILAGVILYGMSFGMRSSRSLERACANSIDFLWLTSGRRVDHSTICNFRTKFHRELKDVSRQIGRISMTLGLIRLNQVGLDGTRIRSSNSKRKVFSAKTIEKQLAELDEQIEKMFSEAQDADDRERDLFGSSSTSSLPPKLSDLQKRKEALDKALALEKKIQARRRNRNKVPGHAPRVPVTDPDSATLPNKEGGLAPNYTPTAAVDSHRGFIVDTDVNGDGYESQTTVPTVDRIEETFGKKPVKLLADNAHGTGKNLKELEDRDIEAYIPPQHGVMETDHPAQRDDLTKAVPESDWDKLPRSRQLQNKLDKSAFIYNSAQDCYYCPLGRKMEYVGDLVNQRNSGRVRIRRYLCQSCDDCPLAGACLMGKSKQRSVTHDEFEAPRQVMLKRLKTTAGQEIYGRRQWICETPFALIKNYLKFRQFLLRGLDKVKTEWLWACISFNLSKLVREVIRMRAEFSAMSG